MPKDRERLNSGVQSVLVKETFRPAELVERIRRLVQTKPASRQRDGSSIVIKVLYVEDNDDNVYMLKMRLELLGDFEVLAAEDGEKGCEMAASERPDIILMDLEMPVMDGWEATRRLKSNTRNPRHPDHRAVRTCTGRRARKGARCGMRRVRYQAGRVRPPGRDRAAGARRPQVTWQ